MRKCDFLACLSASVLAAGLLMGCGASSTEAVSTSEAASSYISEVQSVPENVSSSTATSTSEAESVISETESAPMVQDFISSDGKEKIQMPAGWTDLSGQIDTTGGIGQSYPLQVGSLDEAAFLVSNGEPKSGSAVTSLADYYKVLYDYVPLEGHVFSGIQNLTEQPERTLTASGFAAREFTFSATVSSGAETDATQGTGTTDGATSSTSGEAVVYRVAAVEGNSQYYQFCGWTTPDNADNFAAQFEAVLDSFTEQ